MTGKINITTTMIGLGIFFLLILGIDAAASGSKTVEAIITFSGPPPTLLQSGDEEGHKVGIGHREGKALFNDGQEADYSNIFFMDWYQGKSIALWGYTKILFKDSSWFYFKWDSQFIGRDEAGGPIYKGTGDILKGEGLFKGIRGKVTYQNRRLPGSDNYPKGAVEAKAVFTYSIP